MARKLEIQIIGDASSLERALGRASNAGSSFGSAFAKVGKLAAVGLGALGAGAIVAGKHMVSLASDAAEVDSKFRIVFGRTVPQLTKGIEAFSEATGASRFEMKQQAADMGALLSPILKNTDATAAMSLQFTKLATDLGSFNNVPTKDALEAIRSGLIGEAEPMRAFGVLLSEAAVKQEAYRSGIAKVGAELTEQQKVQARANLIMQQTKLAQGDAERTSGSFANQLKRLKNEIKDTATDLGGALVPALASVLQHVNAFVGKIAAADGVSGKLAVLKNSIADTFGKIDWQAAVDRMQQGLKNADWSKIGNAVGVAIGATLKFAVTLAKDLTKEVAKAVENIDWGAVAKSFGTGLAKSITGLDSRAAEILVHEFAKGDAQTAFRRTLELGLREEFEKMSLPKPQIAAAMKQVAKLSNDQLLDATRNNASEHDLALVIAAKVQAAAAAAKPSASAAGSSVGAALGSGISSGAGGFTASLGATLSAGIAGAVAAAKRAAKIKSPSELTRDELGKPLGEGVIQGLLVSTASLPAKLSQKLTDAIERGRRVIESKRGVFETAFGRLSDRIFAAFDAETDAHQTPAEKLIAQITDRRQMEDLQQALADAIAGGDAQQIARAQEDIQLVSLQKQADAERRNYEARRDNLRQALGDRLAAIQAHFEREGSTVGALTKAISNLMNSYGVDFASAGQNLGNAFLSGLKQAIGKAAGASSAISSAVDTVAGSIKVGKIQGFATGGVVPGPLGAPRLVVAHGGETITPPGARGGGNTIVFQPGAISGFIGSEAQLADTIVRLLERRAAGRPSGTPFRTF